MKINSKYIVYLLVGYTLLLFYWMIFCFGRTASSEYSYNLIPFATIRYFLLDTDVNLQARMVNLIGNIVVFIPFGVLLPRLFKRKFNYSLIAFWFGLFSLEFLQLILRRGDFDVDDFILNTLGFLLGCLLFRTKRF